MTTERLVAVGEAGRRGRQLMEGVRERMGEEGRRAVWGMAIVFGAALVMIAVV
jgi:hypothetical protein